ncbi:hypothetical protein NXS19_001065 [Fusarium pseudograminearum]|nr:hypothetical protein NXS19_001065 [Fusarium pseudograminearum]
MRKADTILITSSDGHLSADGSLVAESLRPSNFHHHDRCSPAVNADASRRNREPQSHPKGLAFEWPIVTPSVREAVSQQLTTALSIHGNDGVFAEFKRTKCAVLRGVALNLATRFISSTKSPTCSLSQTLYDPDVP